MHTENAHYTATPLLSLSRGPPPTPVAGVGLLGAPVQSRRQHQGDPRARGRARGAGLAG